MNRSQRNAINRIIYFYRQRNCYNKVTSIKIKREDFGSFIAVIVRTRRSDCHEYSLRALMCDQYAHIFVGKRGGLRVMDATSGLNSEKTHIQKLI